ncbi:MAG TPA: class I SAM-dependent methyltransferase [Ktedonobacteraceae bacterium]|nr:class I SAM-dependent methyltransferase [Ktedonobacteraceae bacterium]
MHSFTHAHKESGAESASQRPGIVAFSAWWYDLLVQWFVMHGKEQKFRRMITGLVELQPGESVLDVGCGTGTLALVAKKCVGEIGRVCGIDPSPSLLSGARRKAKRSGLSIDFQPGGIEQIPFPDRSFDVVFSTFMMHHVPDDLKRQGLAEIARVLKAGGRLLLIDFKHAEEHQSQPESPAGSLGLQDLPALMKAVGFSQREIGEIPFHIRSAVAEHKYYGFILARKGRGAER